MYKLSNELDEAIRSLFDDPSQGYFALGSENSSGLKQLGLSQKKDVSTEICPLTRISLIRRVLEDWVELKGAEIEEFEGEIDLVGIRYEALATLMALREIQTYFPESKTASKDELEKAERLL
jgi:hypothetical protein